MVRADLGPADAGCHALRPVGGGRADGSPSGIDIVTVIYTTAQGDRINISWLDASQAPISKAGVQTRTIDGRTVLVVTSPSGTAVIFGSAPLASLWATAAAVEAGAGATPTGSTGAQAGMSRRRKPNRAQMP